MDIFPYYQGVIAYVTNINAGDYVTLHNIMPNMRIGFVPSSHDQDIENTKRISNSASYTHLMSKSSLLTREAEHFPKRTPKEYRSPFIEKSKEKRFKGYLVYIPIILLHEGDESSIVTTISIVKGLLKTLFGERLLQIKTQTVGPPMYDIYHKVKEIERLRPVTVRNIKRNFTLQERTKEIGS